MSKYTKFIQNFARIPNTLFAVIKNHPQKTLPSIYNI